MRAIVAGNHAAVGDLYDRYGGLVMALGLRVLHDHSEAEQLTLDVFAEVWEKRDRFNPNRGSVRTFLMTMTRSRAIDRLRRHRTRSAVKSSTDTVENAAGTSGQAGPAEAMMLAETRGAVRAAMAELNDNERAAIELSFFDDLSHSQIAERLETPLGTIKTQIRRGLMKLREHIGRLHGREGET